MTDDEVTALRPPSRVYSLPTACLISRRVASLAHPRPSQAHKLSLVAAVATGALPAYDGVYTEGIREVQGADVAMADTLGFSIKLLGKH